MDVLHIIGFVVFLAIIGGAIYYYKKHIEQKASVVNAAPDQPVAAPAPEAAPEAAVGPGDSSVHADRP